MDGLREFGGDVRIQVAPQELNEVALVSRLSGRGGYSTNALYMGVNANLATNIPRSSISSTAIGTQRHIRYLSWAVTAKRSRVPVETTTICHEPLRSARGATSRGGTAQQEGLLEVEPAAESWNTSARSSARMVTRI